MKKSHFFAVLSLVLGLAICGFATDVFAFTQDQFASAAADGYSVCAFVDAYYDKSNYAWSADIDILVSNTGEEDLRGLPLRVVTEVSSLKEEKAEETGIYPRDLKWPVSYYDFTEDAGSCSYLGYDCYGLGTAEVAFDGNACSIARLDRGTDAVIHCHVESSESLGYFKYDVAVGEAELGTDRDNLKIVSNYDEVPGDGDSQAKVLGRVWVDSNNDSERQDSEEAAPGVLVKLVSKADGSYLAFDVTDGRGAFDFLCDAVTRPLQRGRQDFDALGEQYVLDAFLEVTNSDSAAYTFPVKYYEYSREVDEHGSVRKENHLVAVREVTEGSRSCIVEPVPYSRVAANPFLTYTYVNVPLVKVIDNDTAELRREFITRLYRNFLLREPEPEGLASWEAAVTEGRATGAQLVAGFVHSREFQSQPLDDVQYVTAFYNVILGREPDAAGLDAWVRVLNNGYSKDKVLEGFLNSAEMAALCAGMEIEPGYFKSADVIDTHHKITEFVMRLYENCLGRRYDEEGLRYWVSALASGNMNGLTAAMGFFKSQEFLDMGLDDTEFVTVCYRTLLGREPDAGGLQTWVNYLKGGACGEEVIVGFCGSEEFANLCEQSGISPFGSHVETDLLVYVMTDIQYFKNHYGWMLGYTDDGGEGYSDFRIDIYNTVPGSGTIYYIYLLAPSQYTIGGVSYGMSYSEATRILRGRYEYYGTEDGVDYYITEDDKVILVEPKNGVVAGIAATTLYD